MQPKEVEMSRCHTAEPAVFKIRQRIFGGHTTSSATSHRQSTLCAGDPSYAIICNVTQVGTSFPSLLQTCRPPVSRPIRARIRDRGLARNRLTGIRWLHYSPPILNAILKVSWGYAHGFHYTPRFEFRLLRSIWRKKANETHQIDEAESCILSHAKSVTPADS